MKKIPTSAKVILAALAVGIGLAASVGPAMSGLSGVSGASDPQVPLAAIKPLAMIGAFEPASSAPLLGSSLAPGIRTTFEQFNAEKLPEDAPEALKTSAPGLVDIDQARALLTSQSETLVGAPTSNSRVCLALDNGAFASCPSALAAAGISIAKATSVNVDGTLDRFVLYGVAADGVRSVVIHFSDGHTERAEMGTNSYMFDDPTPESGSGADSVIVESSNGVASVPVP